MKFYVAIFALLACTAFAQQLDPCTPSNTFTWNAIPEAQWGNSTTSQYPLGFQRQGTNQLGQVTGFSLSPDNDPPFCITVPNTQNKIVQVMLETMTPGDEICVRDYGNGINTQDPGTVQRCGKGRAKTCFYASTSRSSTRLVVYCSSGCSTSDVPFYLRAKVSAFGWDASTTIEESPEMWCMTQDTLATTAYPSSLVDTSAVEQATTYADGVSAGLALHNAQPVVVFAALALTVLAAIFTF